MTMTKPTSEQVTFTAAGSGATLRNLVDKVRECVSVKDFGAVGDGVADDTAAIQAAIAASQSIRFPIGTYKVSQSLTPLSSGNFWHFDDVTLVATTSAPVILCKGQSDGLYMSGAVSINCQNIAGSCGVRLLGDTSQPSATTSNMFDQVTVRFATIGVHLQSDGNYGVYYNTFHRLAAIDCTTGLLLETLSGGSSSRNVNANHFGVVLLQRCVDAVVLNATWGNYFDFLEAESNTGTAIKILNAFTVAINGGWIEGNGTNIEIADTPAVYGVYIKAAIDSNLDAADTKFVCNVDQQDRSIRIENSQFARGYGREMLGGRTEIGQYGNATNDQGNAGDGNGRLRVPAKMDFFRHSVGSPIFFMIARTGTEGWVFNTQDDGDLLDMRKTRAGFSCPVTLFGNAWDTNQLRLGNYYLWVDGTGDLRIKNGAPSSDTDGTVVGTQT